MPGEALATENAELKIKLRELEDTLQSIHRGDVDAIVVNDDIYTLESAHASTNRLRQDVLSQMEDAVFAFDRDEHVIYLNAAAERRYGVVSSDVLGRNKDEVFLEMAGADAESSGFAQLAPGEAHRQVAATHRLPDGTDIHVEAITSELLDANARPVGYLAVVRDVTDRRLAEQALRLSEMRLREANENLEATVAARTRELMVSEHALRQSQKMEAVGQLTGGIAHDFNNLLAGIGASLQMLQIRLRQGKTDNAERYISMGQESVRRAAALTQRLLAFARRQTLDPKPTDVKRLVAGMEELIRRSVGPGVALEVATAADLWNTKIDASQLENALLNLCINARDAMLPAGGHLTIAAENRRLDDHAALELELPPGEYLLLCVVDTGSGMSPEIIKRVFDPFFTTKPIGRGTGLGLSMVYGFVRQSGGQIRIDSEPGRGTTMRLYLPRHAGDVAPDSADGKAEAAHDGDGETVLLIEDETTIRAMVTEALEEAGYRVVAAAEGASGLRALQALRRVDLLVTDVGLPGGMNGRQVADAARVERPQLKVLFITGYAESSAVGDGLLGLDMAVLTKPFDIAVLTRKVREMTGK